MDVVVARKGGCCRDMTFALSYVVGQEYNNDLMSYIKAKALEIHSTTDEVVMLDGEVFPGPNPFRFVSVPSLLTVFGEYSWCLYQTALQLHELGFHSLPVYNSQPVLEVLRAGISVIDVVGVLPHIAAQQRLQTIYPSSAAHSSYREWGYRRCSCTQCRESRRPSARATTSPSRTARRSWWQIPARKPRRSPISSRWQPSARRPPERDRWGKGTTHHIATKRSTFQ